MVLLACSGFGEHDTCMVPAAPPAPKVPTGTGSGGRAGFTVPAFLMAETGQQPRNSSFFRALSFLMTWIRPSPPATAPSGACFRHAPQPVQALGSMYRE